ncbi:MAG TPA: hypothetical protein VGF48_16710 [Thermoanaerobaculia bacterium]|jgi:hypothetical protein
MRTRILGMVCLTFVCAAGVSAQKELRTGIDFRAPIVRAAILGADDLVLATHAELYRVRGGTASLAVRQLEHDARLILAPGGRAYAWSRQRGETRRPITEVLLRTLGNEQGPTLRIDKAAGEAEVILGSDAKLILTRAPELDWEGSFGNFRYTFWSAEGRELQSHSLPYGPAVLAADGSAIVILTSEHALAFSANGAPLWRIEGRYRKAAVASDARAALLNPADRKSIQQIHVVTNGRRGRTIELPTAVHHLAITREGRSAAAAGDRGRYFFLDVTRAALREGKALPADRGTPFIFDLELAEEGKVVILGVLHRAKGTPDWPRASVIAMRSNGRVAFTRTVEVDDPTANEPSIDIRGGDSAFVAYTRDQLFTGNVDGVTP